MYDSDCKDFETKLQTYATTLKKANIEVGLSVPATYLIKMDNSSQCECKCLLE